MIIMKIMKIIALHNNRITRIMKFNELQCENHETHENIRIPLENKENLANLKIPQENHANHENQRIRIRITKIMNIL